MTRDEYIQEARQHLQAALDAINQPKQFSADLRAAKVYAYAAADLLLLANDPPPFKQQSLI